MFQLRFDRPLVRTCIHLIASQRLLILFFLMACTLGVSQWPRLASGASSAASAAVSAEPVVTVSAASFAPILAPDAIAAAFGTKLATRAEVATTQPLPTTLAGTTVRINGEPAPLFFVSPGQVNFLIPPGTPSGAASIVITSGDGTTSSGTVQIAAVAPALFAANGNGQGALAALLLRVKANGQQSYEPLAQYSETEKSFVTRPLDFGEESDQLFLILYLTGLRQAATSGVRVSIGGVEYAPQFVGPAAGFAGLDQINLALPRNFGGRGRITILVKASGYGASNAAEFEIGAGTQLPANNAPLQITAPAQTVLAGQELEISGAGFAANPRENTVQVVADDGVTTKADVLGGGGSTIRIRVPLGAGTGQIKISRGQIEASAPISVRTSVSGFIERAVLQDGRIVRVPVPGARVRVIGNPVTERITDDEGSFVLADLQPRNREDFEILPPVNGSLNFSTKKFSLRVRTGRDNQLPRGDEQTIISGVAFPLLADSEASNAEPNTAAAAASPDQNLTLTYLEPGRTPANLPVGHFSTRIAQIAPFGQRISPGARLSFPNADAIPVGAPARLFKFDQTVGSPTLGQFVDIGAATVTADGQRVETAPNAITEGSFYFVSIARPTAAINGRVVESDGRPVPRAIVQARGQSTFTDGFGGFVLRDVPVMKPSGDRVRVEVSYQRPDGRVSRKDGAEVELTAGALATVKPEIALDPVTTNLAPLIIAPASLALNAGEARFFDFILDDPDSAQTPRLAIAGTAAVFAAVSQQSDDIFRLLLSPSAQGGYTLSLTATDSDGALSTQSIAITVNQANNTAPIAHSQSVTTPEDTLGAIRLTGERATRYTLVTPPARGSLSGVAPDLSYMPARDFNGLDSFTFKAGNGGAESQLATVFIVVRPVNDAPKLNVEEMLTVNAGETLNLLVTATDVDGEQRLNLSAEGAPASATFTEVSGTSKLLNWTPTIQEAGMREITFKAADNGSPPLSDTKRLRVTVVDAKWAKTSGPEGSRTLALLNAGGKLYAGTNGGGIYRSTDDGKSWIAVNDGLSGAGLNVWALESSGSALYAGTYGGGVYRSTDEGRKWTPIIRIGLDNLLVWALALHGNRLYAGTNGGGIYRLAENEQSWAQINNGLSPSDGGLNNCALASRGSRLFAGTLGRGAYFSDDGGANWRQSITGLSGGLIVFTSLSSGNNLYLGTQGGVYRSIDNGQSWTAANKGFPDQTAIVLALLSSGNALYAGTFSGGVYRSVDNGQNWTEVNNGLSAGGRVVFSMTANGTSLFAGTDGGGVYRSSDNGGSWSRSAAGIVASDVLTLLHTQSEWFAGTNDGVYRSSDNGQSWTAVNNGLPVNLGNRALRVDALAVSGTSLFAGTDGRGVFRSSDNGQNWTEVNSGLPDRGKNVRALALSGTSLFAGTGGGGVFRSTNNGQSWTAASNGLSPVAALNVEALAVSGTNLFAGTFGGGVYRSTDNGQNWLAGAGLAGRGMFVISLAVSGTSLFAGTFNGGVYRSTDNGLSWTAAGNGLPRDLSVEALAVSGVNLFAGTGGGGVYRSTDNGLSWTPFGSGIFNPVVLSLTFDDTKLLAGTAGYGVHLLTDSEQSWTGSNLGLPTQNTNTVALSGGGVFAGTLGSGVFRSNGEGQSWTAFNTNLPPNANIQSIVTDGATLWAAAFGDGVYRTDNQAARWTQVNMGLANRFVNQLLLVGATLYAGTNGGVFRSTGGGAWVQVNAGLTSPRVVSFVADAGVIYAGTDGGGVFRLNDGGASWTQVNRGLTNQSVTALGINNGMLYAGTAGGGICISSDRGANWTAVNNALPANLNVYAFAVSGKRVYAGSIHGVFITENEGQSWKQINAGLLDVFVTGLAVSGDRLFASTASGGVFSSKNP